MSDLLTIEDVAERLNLPVDQTKKLARRNDWPRIIFGVKTIRYAPEDVDLIVASHRVTAEKNTPRGLPGQTARSKRMAS